MKKVDENHAEGENPGDNVCWIHLQVKQCLGAAEIRSLTNRSAMSPVSALKWMIRNTVSSRDSLTPELAFRLITETCPMWMATPESCPMPDPYWAFYWPGGQAITRWGSWGTRVQIQVYSR